MKWTPWKIFRLLWVTAGIGFTFWLWTAYNAHGVDKALLKSNERVQVIDDADFISFTPIIESKKVFIFFPGAMVETIAYAPLCRKIADSGYKVLLIKMPWRLASKGYNKIRELNLLADKSKTYVLAGHSQGAKIAAQFVYENPGIINQLILMGTTHPRDIDLSALQIPVMKIYGSNDGVAGVSDIEANKIKLPDHTIYSKIEGGNHVQFGYYSFQLGDNKASISREGQQQKVLEAVLSFLETE